MKLTKLVYNGQLVGYRYRVDNNIFDNYLLGYAENIKIPSVRKEEKVISNEGMCYFTSDEYSNRFNKYYINNMNDMTQLILADNLNNMYKRNPNFKLKSSIIVHNADRTTRLGVIVDYNFITNMAEVMFKVPTVHTEFIDMNILGGR